MALCEGAVRVGGSELEGNARDGILRRRRGRGRGGAVFTIINSTLTLDPIHFHHHSHSQSHFYPLLEPHQNPH